MRAGSCGWHDASRPQFIHNPKALGILSHIFATLG